MILSFPPSVGDFLELIFEQRNFSVFLLDLPAGFAKSRFEFAQMLLQVREALLHETDFIIQLLFVILQLFYVVLENEE